MGYRIRRLDFEGNKMNAFFMGMTKDGKPLFTDDPLHIKKFYNKSSADNTYLAILHYYTSKMFQVEETK